MRRVGALGTCGLVLLASCTGGADPSGRARQALPVRPDWSTGLPRLLPGIRACLAETSGTGAGVTKAWPIGLGLTGVRLLESSGERLDCVAVADGDRVLLTEPVRATSRLPGERDPLYTPPSSSPPESACLRTATATSGDGEPVGWLSYDICRDPRPIGAAAGIKEPARQPAMPQEG
jgi:hypothetical protein